MNRQQRRRKEREDGEKPRPEGNLTEYLKHPEMVVRRGELLGVVDKLIRLHTLKRKRESPLNRLRRWLDVT